MVVNDVEKSTARAGLEHAVLYGLAQNSHLTGVHILGRHELLVNDVLNAMFREPVRWAVKEYLEELEQLSQEMEG